MPKVLWVALPLLGAAALLIALALRRRLPSRQALNLWSSVFLLAYLATTASLGVFWVANQQLPVFDWHYLFGYATLLLVALHLWFNFGLVWQYMTRSWRTGARTGAADTAEAADGRRRALGAVGVLLASGAAFALGMRHGRSELRLEWPVPGGGDTGGSAEAAAAGLVLVERYHAYTVHSRKGVLLRAPSVDWGDPPPAFKRYPGTSWVALPAPGTLPGTALDLAALGALLWHTAGVTDARAQVKLRASPSSGALFATELYVAARAVAGLAPGLWHYDAQSHRLERLHDAPPADDLLGAPDEPALRDAPAAVVATAIFRRSGYKYRDRTYRYVLADLGHALENLRVAAAAVGAHAQFVARFDESRCAATLGVDESEEGVLALVALHEPSARAPAAPGPAQWARAPSAPTQRAARWSAPAAPDQSAPALGVTGAMHLATSLRGTAPPLPAPPTPVPVPAELPAESITLPQVAATQANMLDVIKARRSVRRYASTPLPLQALAGVLTGMVRSSAPILSAAVRVDVVVHAVDGVPPGAYRYEAAPHTLVPRRVGVDLRVAARAAALDQDVIGDAAVVFVVSIDRAAFATDPAGPARGYRHAFLEAGIVGARVYLEAGARGLGACAVGAFYDDEATALVAGDASREWVVHFAALGVPSG